MDLKIIIPDEIFQKIMWWINKSNHEVSGFGSLHFDPTSGVFTVQNAILLKQEVGPSSTEIDPVALGKAMYELREEQNALKWHWHSHVDMGVFWSGDDKTLIKNLGSQGWICASVINKKREIKSAFYTMVETMTNSQLFGESYKYEELFLEDISTTIQRYIPNELCEQWDKEYDEHVKTITYRPYNYNSNWLKPGFIKGNAKRKIPKDASTTYEYDDYGFKWSLADSRHLYNPIYDKSLKTDKDILEAIKTMDEDEVRCADNYYLDRACEFDRLYKILRPEKSEKKIAQIGGKTKTDSEIDQMEMERLTDYYMNGGGSRGHFEY